MLVITYCYWTSKSQRCPGIDLITTVRSTVKRILPWVGSWIRRSLSMLKFKTSTKIRKKIYCCFSFPTRYFFLSLQGTYGESLIAKAQKIDKLPKDKRDLKIQSWRSRQMPVPGEAQRTHRPVPPVPEQDFRASTPKSSRPPKQKCTENRGVHGERSSRDHRRDNPSSADSSAKLSSKDHLLLGPNSRMASRAYPSGQTDEYQRSRRGSHRRSQSSLTIWGACRNLYKLRGGRPIAGLINPRLSLSMEERMSQSYSFLPARLDFLRGSTGPLGVDQKRLETTQPPVFSCCQAAYLANRVS